MSPRSKKLDSSPPIYPLGPAASYEILSDHTRTTWSNHPMGVTTFNGTGIEVNYEPWAKFLDAREQFDRTRGSTRKIKFQILQILSRSYYLRGKDTHQPWVNINESSLYSAAVPVFSNKFEADNVLENLRQFQESGGMDWEDKEVIRITELWEFLLESAACGCEGIILDYVYDLKFFNRITDMDKSTPTLLGLESGADEGGVDFHFYDRTGLLENPGPIADWKSLAKMSNLLSNTFSSWNPNHYGPMPEGTGPGDSGICFTVKNRHGQLARIAGSDSILGPFTSQHGAYVLFSTRFFAKNWATHFDKSYKWDDGPPGYRDPIKLSQNQGLIITPIWMNVFLKKIPLNEWKYVDVILNPVAHRVDQGFFVRDYVSGKAQLRTIRYSGSVTDGTGNFLMLTETQNRIQEYMNNDQSKFSPREDPSIDHQMVIDEDIPSAELVADDLVDYFDLHDKTGFSAVKESAFKRVMGILRTPLSEEEANSVLDTALSRSYSPKPFWDGTLPPIDSFLIWGLDPHKTLPKFGELAPEKTPTYDSPYFGRGIRIGPSTTPIGQPWVPFDTREFNKSNYVNPFMVFPDILAGAAYLIHEILPKDTKRRDDVSERILNGEPLFGISSDANLYFSERFDIYTDGGSVNPNDHLEQEIRDPLENAEVTCVRKILFDALTKGYQPYHARLLRSFMFEFSETMPIIECGYFADLLNYGVFGAGEAFEECVNEDNKERTEIVRKIKSAKARMRSRIAIPAKTEFRLRQSLGKTYDLLDTSSRCISASLLDEFDRIGEHPNYDYAGISMKASKLVERTLGLRVFEPWKTIATTRLTQYINQSITELNPSRIDEKAERILVPWLRKRTKLELGSMRLILKQLSESQPKSPLLKSLHRYILNLPDGIWLLSDDFDAFLRMISERWRNGGVHLHVISYDICREAVDEILLGLEPTDNYLAGKPMLATLLAATCKQTH